MKATRELRQIQVDPNAGYMLDTYADRDRLYLQFDLFRALMAERVDRALRYAGLRDGGADSSLRLLDAGCGEGLHLADTISRYPSLRGVGLDRDPEAVSTASAAYRDRLQLAFHRADLGEPIPAELDGAVSGRGFDVAQLIFALQHLHDAPRGLRHIHETLRPGGVIWVCDALDRGFELPHPSFQALFGPLEKMFQRFGTPRCAERHEELLGTAGFTMCETSIVKQELGGATVQGRTALTILLLGLRAARRAYVDACGIMDGAEFDGHVDRLAAEVTPQMAGAWTNRISIARKE